MSERVIERRERERDKYIEKEGGRKKERERRRDILPTLDDINLSLRSRGVYRGGG